MLLYLFALRAMCVCLAHLCSSRHLAASLAGVLHLIVICLPSGLSPGSPHSSHLPIWLDWIRHLSPVHWMAHMVLQLEFEPVDILRYTYYQHYISANGLYYALITIDVRATL